jgi:TolB-like protein/class 3 adenylate cyclase
MPTRRLAAILAADVVGYSRLMGADEEGTHERFKAHRHQLVEPTIKEHHGRIVKNTGDGMLVEFPSVVDAVHCAVEVQRSMVGRNADIPEDKRITLRVGINLGDIIIDDDDIFGDGVNLAVRLEALAEPNGVCISGVVHDQIRDKLPYDFDDMGEQRVKNIARPVHVYAVRAAAAASPPVVTSAKGGNRVALSTAPRLSIVVLPFANLSNDPDQEYFADGITDDLTTDLSRIPGSFVIARNTAFTYKGKSIDVKQVGRLLSVRYVLEGSVRRIGEQVRVNVQLIDAENGAHLWADRFDADRANLADAQDAITGRLARTLNLELVEGASRRLQQERVLEPDARDLVMRGWALFHRPYSATLRQEAQQAFEAALEIDPLCIDASIGIATVLVANIGDAWSRAPEQDKARAERLLLGVLERDANSSSAHFAIGSLRRMQNRLAESRIEFETAIALDRNHARAIRQLGMTLMYLGQPEAAIPHIERAIRLNPYDPNIGNYFLPLGLCHLFLDHVDEAINLLRKARAANPRLYYLHLHLAGALGLHGDVDEAKTALAEGVKLKPDSNSLAGWRALFPWGNPQYGALLEKTVAAGLRRAGMAEA